MPPAACAGGIPILWRQPFLAHSPRMSARLTVHFSGIPAAHLAAVSGLAPAAASTGDSTTDAGALFGLSGPDLPLAAITYTHDFGTPPPAWCARLDPVCLMPSGATLRLLDLAGAPLTDADAQELFQTVSTAGVIPAVQWRMGAAHRWYVLCTDTPDVRTCPPDNLPGGQIADRQPTGRDAARWQNWLNELQMLLFDAPPNLVREARDLPPANGLWLWGGGATPTLAQASFDTVWTDQPLVGGLARLADRLPQAAPKSATDWLAALPEGHALLGLAPGEAAPDRAAHWLAALQGALDSRRLDAATLQAGGARFDLRRQGLLARLRRGLRRAAGR